MANSLGGIGPGVEWVASGGDDEDEFFAAETAGAVAGADGVGEDPAEIGEDLVADGVTASMIIDGFEVIDIDHEDGGGGIWAFCPAVSFEAASVGDFGE